MAHPSARKGSSMPDAMACVCGDRCFLLTVLAAGARFEGHGMGSFAVVHLHPAGP